MLCLHFCLFTFTFLSSKKLVKIASHELFIVLRVAYAEAHVRAASWSSRAVEEDYHGQANAT